MRVATLLALVLAAPVAAAPLSLLRTFTGPPTPYVIDLFGSRVVPYGTNALLVSSIYGQSASVPGSGRGYVLNVNTGSIVQTFDNPTPALFDYF